MHQKVQKKTFFCDVTKSENFDASPKLKILIKNILPYRKRTKKSPFEDLNFFAWVGQNPL
jgi:hypothetical protein